MMHRSRYVVVLIGLVALLALVGAWRLGREFIGARAVPALTSTTLGGQLSASVLSPGTHRLEYRATTKTGQSLSDTVTFTVPGTTAQFSGVLAFTDQSKLLKLARQQSGGQWAVETVSAITGVTELNATRDSSGALHLVYTENSRLTYATNAGGAWRKEVLDGPANFIGRQTIAVDKNGKIHVVYVSISLSQAAGLKYATNSSGQWRFSTVPTPSVFDTNTGNMAVGTDGVVHVVYQDEDRVPHYARRDTGGTWQSDPIDIKLANPQFIVFVLDSQNQPYILYQDDSDWFEVRYAELRDGAWQHETIKRFNDIGFTSAGGDMTVDSTGHPHITLAGHTNQANRSVYVHAYITRDSANAWIELLVEAAQEVGSMPFSAGNMAQQGEDSHIVYRHYPSNKVFYAHCHFMETSCFSEEVRINTSTPTVLYYAQLVP